MGVFRDIRWKQLVSSPLYFLKLFFPLLSFLAPNIVFLTIISWESYGFSLPLVVASTDPCHTPGHTSAPAAASVTSQWKSSSGANIPVWVHPWGGARIQKNDRGCGSGYLWTLREIMLILHQLGTCFHHAENREVEQIRQSVLFWEAIQKVVVVVIFFSVCYACPTGRWTMRTQLSWNKWNGFCGPFLVLCGELGQLQGDQMVPEKGRV